MDRILCVVHGHTRPCADRAGRTAHKMYCTEELHRRSLALEWIGSYVSCTGTHVLEQTVQGARHIRCIVLRSSTDGRWLLQGKSGKSGVARFVQYGDCIGTLLP